MLGAEASSLSSESQAAGVGAPLDNVVRCTTTRTGSSSFIACSLRHEVSGTAALAWCTQGGGRMRPNSFSYGHEQADGSQMLPLKGLKTRMGHMPTEGCRSRADKMADKMHSRES